MTGNDHSHPGRRCPDCAGQWADALAAKLTKLESEVQGLGETVEALSQMRPLTEDQQSIAYLAVYREQTRVADIIVQTRVALASARAEAGGAR